MKKCPGCKVEKLETEFYKNKTRSDGLQNFCKGCSKNKWGKWFGCTSCFKSFYVGHRNVSQRKTKLCSDCIKTARIESIVARNKASAKDFIYSEKGYKYIRDLSETHGYKFVHRKIMEEKIGRPLTKDEVVHHIDGNKLNNDISNLHLTNKVDHAKSHYSLELLGFQLIREGKIIFDKETGQYRLTNEVERSKEGAQKNVFVATH